MRPLRPVIPAVAAVRIADHLDLEVGCDGAAGELRHRPGPFNPEDAVLEQHRVRGFGPLREAGAVGTIDCREDRIAPTGRLPAIPDRLDRQAHRVARLVTGDAGPPVGAERCEERMAGGLDRTPGQHRPQHAVGVGIVERFGPGAILAWAPPAPILLRPRRGERPGDQRRQEQEGGCDPRQRVRPGGGQVSPRIGPSNVHRPSAALHR